MNSKPSIILLLLTMPVFAWALPFTITPKAGTSLPTTMISGQPVNAYYTIKNNTNSVRAGNYLKYLPMNVTQVTSNDNIADLCGATFTLQPKYLNGDSCTLQLLVSGAVDANNTDPRQHLFACFPGGISCAGTPSPLNVSVIPTGNNVVAGGTFFDGSDNQFMGIVNSINNGSSWLSQVLMPPSGYQKGIINGVSGSNNFFVGVGVYNDSLDNYYSSLATSNDHGNTWSQQILPYPTGYLLSMLSGIDCIGGACIAVGSIGNLNTNNIQPLIVSSNNFGVAWSQEILPELPGFVYTQASGISCNGSNCVAVGSAQDEGFVDSQAWVANSNDGGATWSQQVLPYIDTITHEELLGVSCSNLVCIAVGNYVDDHGVSYPGIALTTDNGSTWSQTKLPILAPFEQSFYSGISCTPDYCVAVGLDDNYSLSSYFSYPAIAVTTNNGASWTQQALSVPSEFTYGQLTSVTCTNSTCIAAGFYQNNNLSQYFPFTAVSTNSGNTWTQTTIELPQGYVQGQLNGIG